MNRLLSHTQSGHLSSSKWISYFESKWQNCTKYHCNLFCVQFPMYKIFENKILEFSDTERSILGRIIAEARNCFASPWIIHILKKWSKKYCPFWFSEASDAVSRRTSDPYDPQIHYRTLFCFCRIYDSCQTSSETCRNIIHYLGEHVRQSLTIEDISKDNMIGRSQLQKLFREEYQCGVIEFFSVWRLTLPNSWFVKMIWILHRYLIFWDILPSIIFPDSSKSCPAWHQQNTPHPSRHYLNVHNLNLKHDEYKNIYNKCKCTCPLNGQEGGNMQICKVKIIRNSAERRPIWLRHR